MAEDNSIDPTVIIDRTVGDNLPPEPGLPQVLTPEEQIQTTINNNPVPHVGDPQKAVTDALAASTAVPSVGDLPWAIVAMPTTSAGQGGIGQNRHELQPESWVIGFFLDADCQQPIITGVLPGGPGGGSSGGYLGNAAGGGSSTSTTGPVATDNRPVSDKEIDAAKYLMQKGYKAHEAAGIVANLSKESSMNPGNVNPRDGRDGSDSIGLAQWNAGRAQELKRQPNWHTVNGQLDFVDKELHTYKQYGLRELRNSTSAAQAAEVFCRKFEIPGNVEAEVVARAARANAIYKRLMEQAPQS